MKGQASFTIEYLKMKIFAILPSQTYMSIYCLCYAASANYKMGKVVEFQI